MYKEVITEAIYFAGVDSTSYRKLCMRLCIFAVMANDWFMSFDCFYIAYK